MSHLDSRNKRALASGQAAWDNALPPEDDGEREYVDARVAELLEGCDTDGVDWHDFAQEAGERIASDDEEFVMVKILLAIRERKRHEAISLHMHHFEHVICSSAEDLVRKAMERK